MKKNINILTAIIIALTLLAGCSSNDDTPGNTQGSAVSESNIQSDISTENTDAPINILCTVFPQYDWIKQIIGEENLDNFDISILLSSNVDLHNYTPSVQDMIKVKSADIFVYVGGHSDNWVEAALADGNPNMIAISLMDLMGDRVIMTEHDHDDDEDDHDHEDDEDDHDHEDDEDDHDHEDDDEDDHDHEDDEDDHDDDHDHELEEDEHVWVSLKNAVILCNELSNILGEAMPHLEADFRQNADAYIAELNALDAEYEAAVSAARVKTIVVPDRFPFVYLTHDYGLEHYAAFDGCSAETEAGFAIIIELAGMVDKFGLKAVIVTETSDESIAKTVINNTADKNQEIVVLNTAHAVTDSQLAAGASYLGFMRENLEALIKALS